MKNYQIILDKKKLLLVIIGGMLGVILIVAILNGYVLFKFHKLENKVEKQQEILNANVVEKVTEVIHDPMYFSGGGNVIEAETLINTEELLSAEQIKELRAAVIEEVEAYVTKDVYLGVQELLYEELNAGIYKAVEEVVSDKFTEEQLEMISSAIQDVVLEETASSIKKISKEVGSQNKLVKALERTVTLLGKRMDTLESTLDESVSQLKKKDRELEKAINILRISFVDGNIGTSDLQMLSVQMVTNKNILFECQNAIQNNLTNLTSSEKESYLETINVYFEQIEDVEKTVEKALDDGGTDAGNELAEKAAELSKQVVEFGSMIEESKISLDNVKTQLQGQIDMLDKDVEELEASTRNNTSRITDLQKAKSSLEAADSSLFAISEALQAADRALEKTSSDNLNIALTKISSLVGSIPEDSDVATQLSQAQKALESAKENLEMAIVEGNADAIAEAENSAAAALASARNEIETSIEAIIGDIPDGETISSLFANVDTDIDKVKEDLTIANNNLSSAKIELETAITSGNADAIAEAEKKVSAAKTELNTAITNAQNGLQSNINTIEGQVTDLNNAVTEANTKIVEAENSISGLKTEVNTKASQNELRTTTATINQNIQEVKQEMDDVLSETTDTINNSMAQKADKSELENVMKAKVSTDASGKTTITMIIEGE